MGAGQGGQGRRRRGRGARAARGRPGRPGGGVPAGRRWRPRRSCPATAPRVLAQLGYDYAVRRRRQRRAAAPRRAGVGRATPARPAARPAGAAVPAAREGAAPSRRESVAGVKARVRAGTRLAMARAPDRQPLPPQRGPVRGRRGGGHRTGAGRRARAASWSRAGTSPRASARSSSLERFDWLDASVGVHPHDAAKVDDAGWRRIVGAGGATRASSRSARPGSTTTGSSRRSRTSSRTSGATSRWRSTRASRRSSTCRSTAGQRDAQDAIVDGARGRRVREREAPRRSADRPPAVIHSFSGPVDYARRGARPRPRDLVLRPGLPGRRGGHGRGRRRSCPPIACSSRPTRRSSRRPAAPRGRNEPEWVRITAAWVAERRGTDAATPGRCAGGRLRPNVRGPQRDA